MGATYKKQRLIKTFWGRYLIFSVVALICSLLSFFTISEHYPNPIAHFFILNLMGQVAYWVPYLFGLLQFHILVKHKYLFIIFSYATSILFITAGTIPLIISTFRARSEFPIDIFMIIPTTGILLAGIHLFQLRSKMQLKHWDN